MNCNLPATQKQNNEWCPTNAQHMVGKLPGDGNNKKIPHMIQPEKMFSPWSPDISGT